ncbi:MAG: hypothetical protein SNJ74_04135 [Fimbriimonadaceae bacterium]
MSLTGASSVVRPDQRRILRFYSPLAASWIFMALESPICVGLISRMPDAKVNTAAFFVVMAIAIFIESPVIDLLTTSTALTRNRRDYRVLMRFVWLLMGAVTLAHGILVFTPLYGWVTSGLLGLPAEVAEASRTPLQILLLWSAFIGWRRTLQGLMIRHGQTRLVGVGTAVRVTTLLTTALALAWLAPIPSLEITAWALLASVAAEAAFIHWASRPTIRAHFAFAPAEPGPDPGVTWGKLLAFHMPLTGTTLVMMCAAPLVAGALARAPDAILATAGWQVAMSLVWLTRTVVFAIPEVVIALHRDGMPRRSLRVFSLRVGMAMTLLAGALWLTGGSYAFFTGVLSARPDVAREADLAVLVCLLLPFLGALQNYFKGMLAVFHVTGARLVAIGISVATLFVLLQLGLWLGLPGVVVAGGALTIGQIVEALVLGLAWLRIRHRDAEPVPQAA